MRLLTQHNQDGTKYSSNLFPHKRMESEHKARSWNLTIPRVNRYNNNLVYIQNKANAFIKLCIIVHIFLLLFPVTKHGCQRGVPRIRMLGNNHTKAVDQRLLPSTTDAVQWYQQQGGQLTDPWQVGKDPLEGNAYKYGVRQEAFLEKYPSFQNIFSKLVNGDETTFKQALKFYIDITHRISSS